MKVHQQNFQDISFDQSILHSNPHGRRVNSRVKLYERDDRFHKNYVEKFLKEFFGISAFVFSLVLLFAIAYYLVSMS